MDSNTHTPRTAKFARRALPVFAIAVLTIGLGACQTPRQGDTRRPDTRSIPCRHL